MTTTASLRQTDRAPQALPAGTGRAVLVQSGARDAYQVALALEEAGLLEALVTDLFWPSDRPWARQIAQKLPSGLQSLLAQRSAVDLPARKVRLCSLTGAATLLLEKLPAAPASLRRRMMRHADATLGRTAGRLANRRGSGLLSYSYYGYDAFTEFWGRGILFQLHPHPASMRRILNAELERHPDCASSLEQEWELALPDEDFEHLVRETTMAQAFLAASSFTRSTLVEHGAAPQAIEVVPYGVDASRFVPDPERGSAHGGKLRLLFVGRINQRKGIKYLLQALQLLRSRELEVTVCGRVVDDLKLFEPFAEQIKIRPDVSAAELSAAYQAADLFVFPSVAEGFGQVLLESLASGLPILSTTRTAAPDLITEGRQGFIVDPGQPEQLAERMEWALTHRAELFAMRHEARLLAETFTWERFRKQIAVAVGRMLLEGAPLPPAPSSSTVGGSHAL